MTDARASTERARDDADEAKAIAAVAEIERLLRNMSAGWRNTDAVKAIHTQIGIIESMLHQRPGWAYVREKLSSLRGDVDILYSARKHARYGGVETVTSHALADCANARSGIRTIFCTA